MIFFVDDKFSEAEGLTATEKDKIKISENELSLLSLVDVCYHYESL